MTVYGGPDIVANGLVLHLDAGNNKSYPGSGTVWTDLTGNNNNGTLTNGPVYSSLFYNRALSATEVAQNYNTLKGRYNL